MRLQIFAVLLSSLVGWVALDTLALNLLSNNAATASAAAETEAEFFHRGSGR